MSLDKELYCEEWNGDEEIRLKDLIKLIPKLQSKYGVNAAIRFDAGANNVHVMVTPTTIQRLRGKSYGKFNER